MLAEEVKRLSIEEKMYLMEILWQDMRDLCDQGDSSEEQKALLDARRERVRLGTKSQMDSTPLGNLNSNGKSTHK